MTHPPPRTIAITGAGTGIGAACARRFARRGDRVVLIGRRQAPLDALAAETGGLAQATSASTRAATASAVRTKPTTRSGALRCMRTSTPHSSARARACPT